MANTSKVAFGTGGEPHPAKQKAERKAPSDRDAGKGPMSKTGDDPLEVARQLRALEALLGSEQRVRQATDENELVHLIANEVKKMTGARQALVFRRAGRGSMRVRGVSSVAVIDRDTPFIRWIEKIIAKVEHETGLSEFKAFNVADYASQLDTETANYPFPFLAWQPLKLGSADIFAGIVVAREKPWMESDKQFLNRQADVYTTYWKAVAGPRSLRTRSKRRWAMPIITLGLAALACVPVPMTALAPVEIVAAQPQHVTAPLDEVVAALPKDPNEFVKAGDVILRFEETKLLNQLKVAVEEQKVAASRYDRAQQASFSDEGARHELAITLNELLLKRAERNYVEAQYEKAVIRAQRDGVLIYTDKDRLLGRPVKTGERLMQIADPAKLAARIELPVADAIVLEKGSSVRLFLDSNPLASVPATLTNTAYHAEPNSTQQLVYRLRAEFGADHPEGARIGARGTAQLSGAQVPLAYFLLRRPISALRQYFGI